MQLRYVINQNLILIVYQKQIKKFKCKFKESSSFSSFKFLLLHLHLQYPNSWSMATPTKPDTKPDNLVLKGPKETGQLQSENGFSLFKTPIKKLLLPFLSTNSKQNCPQSHLHSSTNNLTNHSVNDHSTLQSSDTLNSSKEFVLPAANIGDSGNTPETPSSILQSVKNSSLLLEYSSLRISAPLGCYIIPDRNDFYSNPLFFQFTLFSLARCFVCA